MLTNVLKSVSYAGISMTLTLTTPLEVDTHSVTVQPLAKPLGGYFKLGTSHNTRGDDISLDSQSLLFNGKPWFPIMGELHFSRYPQAEWREALEKMKAGGIKIVSTYVFWNHHEEIEGEWDWSGQKDLRAFLETCRDVGLMAIVRCGPWCNGEVRYGGFPDWVQNSTRWAPPARWGLRPENPDYFAAVARLYSQIGEQMQGLLWKDGGPVIGIQLDNEYSGPSKYLIDLKNLALASGMDVPLYTKTGWPRMEDTLPAGEMIPFYGAYPDAAWEDSVEISRGLLYNYIFRHQRIDESIASDVNTIKGVEDESHRAQYPFLTAETGGGMFVSYHRRNKVAPRDVASLALCQVGSGCVGIGYYLYHGGENPEGRATTLHKSNEIGDVFDTTGTELVCRDGRNGGRRAVDGVRLLGSCDDDFLEAIGGCLLRGRAGGGEQQGSSNGTLQGARNDRTGGCGHERRFPLGSPVPVGTCRLSTISMFFYTISQDAQTLGRKTRFSFCSALSRMLRPSNTLRTTAIDWWVRPR